MKTTPARSTVTIPRGSAETGTIIVIGSVAFVALAASFLFFKVSPAKPGCASPVTPLAVGKPLQQATFDDGSTLQILNIGVGEIVEGSRSAKPRGSWFSNYSSGSSTRSMSGNGVEGSIEEHTMNDQLTCLHFSSPPANLLLETRLLSGTGSALKSNRILWQNEIRNRSSNPDFPGWEAMLSAQPGDDNLPEVVVQLADGAGGWIDGCGPCVSEGDQECRGMIAFTAWPQTQAELEFRAARPGAKPLTWKIKNPRQAKKSEPWTAAPLPQTHSEPDFDLSLEAVSRATPRVVQPKFRFLSKLPGDKHSINGKFDDPAMLDCVCEELQGAFGTRSKKGFLKLTKTTGVSAFSYPPDERLLRFRFVIKPGNAYPYPRSESLPVARVKIAADGKSLEHRPTLLTGHGILSVDFTNIQSGNKGGFQYTVKGRWNNASEKAAGMAMLQTNKTPVCFKGDCLTSGGESDQNGSGATTNNNVTEYDYSVQWSGPLSPGDEFTVGMTPALPPREVFFTFEP